MSNKWTQELRARIAAGDRETIASIPHGTVYGYASFGCRCDACKSEANRYYTERRHRKGISKPRPSVSEDDRFRALLLAQRVGPVAAAAEMGITKAKVLYWRTRATAETEDRLRVLAEVDQVRAAGEGRHCPVDGVPLPPAREATCSHRCAELWVTCRYQLDEGYRAVHKDRIALWNIEHTDDPVALRYARRVIHGGPIATHGRWTNSPAMRAALDDVMERRAVARKKWGDLACDLPTPTVLAEA